VREYVAHQRRLRWRRIAQPHVHKFRRVNYDGARVRLEDVDDLLLIAIVQESHPITHIPRCWWILLCPEIEAVHPGQRDEDIGVFPHLSSQVSIPLHLRLWQSHPGCARQIERSIRQVGPPWAPNPAHVDGRQNQQNKGSRSAPQAPISRHATQSRPEECEKVAEAQGATTIIGYVAKIASLPATA
jgi:hypothetical protein